MNHTCARPGHFLLAIIVASSVIGIASGCATTQQAAPPTATTQVTAPSATPGPTIAPTPQPSPRDFKVGNTNGLGAYLRQTPQGDRIKAWADGAVMMATGGDQIVDGNTWRNVRDPDGNEGWMVIDYLVPQEVASAPPSETPAAKLP